MILVQIFQPSTVVAQKLVKILYEKWSLIELLLDNFLANRLSLLTKFASKWNAVGRWPLLYWSAGLQSTTKNLTPSFWKTHGVKQKERVKSEGWTNKQDILKQVIFSSPSNIPCKIILTMCYLGIRGTKKYKYKKYRLFQCKWTCMKITTYPVT